MKLLTAGSLRQAAKMSVVEETLQIPNPDRSSYPEGHQISGIIE
jgi:hypothetical protein